jgi:F-type H+-transporting ATPase subunit b
MFVNLACLSLRLLAEGAAVSPMQFRIDTLIFSLLIFVVLAVVLARYGWRPIMDGLERREKSIAQSINDANTANQKAQAILAQYEQRLKAASDEAARMMAEAKADADRARERMLNEAKEEAQRQRDRAVAEISAARDAAVRDLAERSVDSAVILASRLVGKELKPDDHARLIEQSLERFSRN